MVPNKSKNTIFSQSVTLFYTLGHALYSIVYTSFVHESRVTRLFDERFRLNHLYNKEHHQNNIFHFFLLLIWYCRYFVQPISRFYTILAGSQYFSIR